MEMDVSDSILENVNLLETDFSEQDRYDLAVRQLCCSNLSKAFAMRIIAYEVHLTAVNQQVKNGDSSKTVDA
ncbi:hypothetical protein G6F68_021750 [Rhizopus microsporus]|nr:hypothetical protein G6F68_021750 [Rhizopus microsporus]